MSASTPLPAGAVAFRSEFRGKGPETVGAIEFGECCAEIHLGQDSLWAVIAAHGGNGIAVRCAWAPGEALTLISAEGGEFFLGSSLGVHHVLISSPDGAVLRVTGTLTPDVDLLVPEWPRDIYPFGPGSDPQTSPGEVLAAQSGLNTGLLFCRLDGGTFLYVQNLTALNAYFQATATKPDGSVGGIWPELGYRPPVQSDAALAAGKEIVLTDALLRMDPRGMTDKRVEAAVFLDHLAAVYPHLDRSVPECHDWPARAEAAIRDLTESPLATTRDGGYRYVRPYVDAEVPDSMVQITLLNALHAHAEWKGEPSELAAELREGLYRFFDPEIGTLRRYLGNVGEEKNAQAVDCWYLYHPLRGLARMARTGDEGARELFLASLAYGVQVARHFDYKWPIQFSLETLEILTAERKPGDEGQTDAGGMYAYTMLDAYELTGDPIYLEEAKRAIHATGEMEFDLAYQTNLTSWGATACVRLWKVTGERFFLDQAAVFLASVFHYCVLWDARIGRVPDTPTFFGLTCLHDAPYMAPFECYESALAMEECLVLAEDDLSDAARLLMTEFRRYALYRTWFSYPGSLPETAISPQPRNGENVRALAFPLEDLYVDGQPAGQVGQEVYGAGMALAYTVHAFHPLDEERRLFCEYPFREVERTATSLTFGVRGAAGSVCSARLLGPEGAKVEIDGRRIEGESFSVTVGDRVSVRWPSRPRRSR